MEICERLAQLIAEANVTPYEIYLKTGVYQSSISRLMAGKSNKLNIRNSELLANYFGVRRQWLMNGEEPRKANNDKIYDFSPKTNAPEVAIDTLKTQWELEKFREAEKKLEQEVKELRAKVLGLEIENGILKYKLENK